MRLDDLAVCILHQIGPVAVQHADRTVGGQWCGMLPALETMSSRFHTDQLYAGHVDVGIEHAHRIGAAADAGDHRVRLPAGQFRHLHQRFFADDSVEVAHQHRVGVRACHRADDVEGVFDVGHPVSHRLVERVLECLRAALDRHHGRTEQFHPEHIG